MAIDNGDPRNRDALMATLGRAGSVLANAGTQFLSHGLDITGRRSGGAAAEAAGAEQDRASSTTWIDRLLENYRQYLGEMAMVLPMVAQRISKDLEPATGERLLLRIDLDEEFRNAFAAVARIKSPFDKAASAKSLSTMTADASTSIGAAVRPMPITGLKDLIAQYEKLRTLPKLLDRFKYDFRRRGIAALSEMPDAFRDLGRLYTTSQAALEALPSLLGETVLRRIVDDRLYDSLELAYKSRNGAHLGWLREKLTGAGLVLSGRVSLLARGRGWLLLDHEKNWVFEVRLVSSAADTPKQWLEIYGQHEGHRYTVKLARTSRELLLPVRVQDASQGLAVWTIDKRIVQDYLDSRRLRLKAWDIGASKTPVALCIVDYREGDLGPYFELGLGCFATPFRDPLAVGMFLVGRLPVTSELACEAGKQIWGYDKVEDDLQIQYRDRSVTCTQRRGNQPMVTFTLPRRGDNKSAPVPLFTYTQKAGGLHRTVITRGGEGETVRSGGSGVELIVDLKARTRTPLCDDLLYFGLVDETGKLAQAPLFTAWTEKMTGVLEAPCVVVPREPDIDVPPESPKGRRRKAT